MDRMLDEMRPEQMLEWMAYMTLEAESSEPTYTDPAAQEAILRKAMGF